MTRAVIKSENLLIAAVGGLFVSCMNETVNLCMCGHLNLTALPGSLLCSGVLLSLFIRSDSRNIFVRLVIDVCLALTVFILIKNVGDILWWGHEPLLG